MLDLILDFKVPCEDIPLRTDEVGRYSAYFASPWLPDWVEVGTFGNQIQKQEGFAFPDTVKGKSVHQVYRRTQQRDGHNRRIFYHIGALETNKVKEMKAIEETGIHLQ